jgi:hypothetical protein
LGCFGDQPLGEVAEPLLCIVDVFAAVQQRGECAAMVVG